MESSVRLATRSGTHVADGALAGCWQHRRLPTRSRPAPVEEHRRSCIAESGYRGVKSARRPGPAGGAGGAVLGRADGITNPPGTGPCRPSVPPASSASEESEAPRMDWPTLF